MIVHLLDSIHLAGAPFGSWRACITSKAPRSLPKVIARITGIPGVAMATSGPGATNLLTGDRQLLLRFDARSLHHGPVAN